MQEGLVESKSFFSDLKKYEIGMLIGSIIIIIGSLLPWVKAYDLFESATFLGVEILFGIITLLFGLIMILLVFICKKFDKKVISNRLGVFLGFITIVIAISITQGVLEMGYSYSYSFFSPVVEADIGVFVTLIGGIILGIFSGIGGIRGD